MEMVKVQKGTTIKTIPSEYKKDYINAGWGEVKQPTNKTVGVNSSNKYGNDKY
ncbi:MAG: hypothetical protein ACI4PF_01115 [Christensenellales bacterium]